MMNIHRLIPVAAFALAVVGGAHADGLRQAEGQSIDLGDVSGVAYYTVEREGLRVVATLAQTSTGAQGEAGTPMRVETVLAPGQSVVLSTPRGVGAPPEAVTISRRDDRVLIQRTAVTN